MRLSPGQPRAGLFLPNEFFPAANVDKAAGYYVNTLGFTLDGGDDEGGMADISRGNRRLFITNRPLFVSSMISGARRKRTNIEGFLIFSLVATAIFA